MATSRKPGMASCLHTGGVEGGRRWCVQAQVSAALLTIHGSGHNVAWTVS